MVRKFFPLLALLIVGCASIPGTQNMIEGRFFQMSVNDYLVFQLDSNTPEICAQSVKSVHKRQGVKIVCVAGSRQYELPFYFVMTNALSPEKTFGRARTNEACEIFISELKKDPTNRLFKYSECELSKN